MILTGNTRSTLKINSLGEYCFKITFSTTIPYGAAWDSTRVFAVKARRQIAWITTRTAFDC